MKHVVEDVLRRSTPSSGNVKLSSTQTKRNTDVSAKPVNSENVINNIQRPNYQQQKQKERLKVLRSEHHSSKYQNKTMNQPVDRSSKYTKDSLSKLIKVTLSEGKNSAENGRTTVHSNTASPKKAAQFIGKSKDGTSVWHFPEVHEQMKGMFNGNVQASNVGVVSSELCSPGQLFIVDETLKAFPDMHYHLEWDKSQKQGFILELYLQDETRMVQVLNKIYQTINRHSMTKIESHTTLHPSAWLLQKLDLDNSYNRIAVLEGLPYYDSFGLIDRYISQSPKNTLTYKIEACYLALMGSDQVVSNAIQQLKKEANRYLDVR